MPLSLVKTLAACVEFSYNSYVGELSPERRPQSEDGMPRGIPKKKAEQANGQDITKWEAVQRALSALGNDATPLQIKDFIKSHFRMNLETSLISNYKHSMLKKGAGKSSVGRKPQSQAAAQAGSSGGITVADIKAVKEVVDRLGADKVLDLAQVLSK
jgi:hypothetical protein